MAERAKIGIVGCGFWAQYQAAAWHEIPEVEIISACDASLEKVKAFAAKFNIARVYTDFSKMLEEETLDFIDIISSPETHASLVLLAAKKKVTVICQKPMALDWNTAKKMVAICQASETQFFIHENFRWQAPMRRVREIIDSGLIGKIFKARIYFNTIFPVLKNQPSLGDMEQMIIADLGVHLFDLVRFFFGEVRRIFCRTQRIAKNIRGEDVANTFMETISGVHCYVELSWASYVEYDCFPQTLIYIEGETGSINLQKDCVLSIIKPEGITTETVPLPHYSWVHPEYAVAHSALVACNRDLLSAIKENTETENRAELNLETLRLVYAAYHSAKTGEAVDIGKFK